jgi:sugar lactone lactonase YvrE
VINLLRSLIVILKISVVKQNNKTMKNTLTSIALFFIGACTHGQGIAINADKLYPEGTAYSKKQRMFFISSIYHGQVGTLDYEGNYKRFTDDADLIASVGILADEKHNILYVTNVDNGVAAKTNPATAYKVSEVIAFDLTTGKRKFSVDLGKLNAGQPNFINDLTMDAEGNVYVTNSFSPIIFRIDKDHKASVFARNDSWKGEGFNLNGIVYHPDGYLIVAQSSKGILYKIDIKNPVDVKVIQIDEPVVGVDGIILNGKNELVIMLNASSKILKLTTTDGWKHARLANTKEVHYHFQLRVFWLME